MVNYDRLCIMVHDSIFINSMSEQKSSGNKPARVYTSYNDEMPGQLSYQNIKLANFIELELTDLYDSLQQIQPHNYKNYVKDCLSRSYNAFHEMQKLFYDLGMSFLYTQTKKLISGYGILFVFLQEKLEEKDAEILNQKSQIESLKERRVRPHGGFRTQIQMDVKSSIDNVTGKKEGGPHVRLFKRLKGVHLFNESYARHIDYDIEQFRKMREDAKEKQQERENTLTREQQQAKLKKLVQDEFNDQSHLTVDGEELYIFLNRQRYVSQQIRNISLGDELEKIASFFKQSQNQALEFLRQSKTQESFHELTEGFNVVVEEYQKCKASQMDSIRDKLNEVLEQIKFKSLSIEAALVTKEKEIEDIKNKIVSEVKETADGSSQTTYNFDDEIKSLYRKIVELQMANDRMRNYVKKCLEDQKKERDALYSQLCSKDTELRQAKENLDHRNQYVGKVERRVRILAQNNRIKDVVDPISYFNGLDEVLKKAFLDQLKQQGFFHTKRFDKQSKVIQKNVANNDNFRNKQPSYQPYADKPAPVYSEQPQKQLSMSILKRREGSFVKRNLESKKQQSYSQITTRKNSGQGNKFKNKVINGEGAPSSQFNDDYLSKTSNSISGTSKGIFTQSNRENIFKQTTSKKIIALPRTPYQQNLNEEKIRVFDIQPNLGDFGTSKKLKPGSAESMSSVMEHSGREKGLNEKQMGPRVTEMEEEDSQVQEEVEKITPAKLLTVGKKKSEDKNQMKKKARIVEVDNRNSKQEEELSRENEEGLQNLSDQEEISNKKIYQGEIKKKVSRKKSSKKMTKSKSKEKKQNPSKEKALHQSHYTEKQEEQYEQDDIERTENVVNCKEKQVKIKRRKTHRKQDKNRISCQMSLQKEKIVSDNENDDYKEEWEEKQSLNQSETEKYLTQKSSKYEERVRKAEIIEQFNMVIQATSNIEATRKQNVSFYQEKLESNRKLEDKSGQGSETRKKILNKVEEKGKKPRAHRETQKNFLSRSKNKQNQTMNSTTKISQGFKGMKKLASNEDEGPYGTTGRKQKLATLQSNVDNDEQKICGWDENQSSAGVEANTMTKLQTLGRNGKSGKNPNCQKRDQPNPARELLEMNFTESEVIEAAEKANSPQQFKLKVLKLHKSKCGSNCKHLQRYMNVYTKFKKLSTYSRRELVKIHIQNLSAHFSEDEEEGLGARNVGLPAIRK